MNDDAFLAQPLTEAEIQQLDAFSGQRFGPGRRDGYLDDGWFYPTLASGPNLMMPSSMLRWIWDAENGVEAPIFPNAAASKHIVGLIIRHWNSVNDTLN
jgi:uncharacterized protein